MLALCLVFILSISMPTASAQEVATETEVSAHVGSTVALPCRVDVNQCGQLHSVKWYKDMSRIYVLSKAGSVARAEGDATDRMEVEYSVSTAEALLKISPVKVEDEATYKCEITYLEVIENCDVVQIVKLQTLVKPQSVRILRNNGMSMANSSILGPADEGEEVDLICEALGGRPTPKVTWYNGTREIKRAAYTAIDSGDGVGTGTSKLQLTLSRGDLNARFECRVESAALEEPIISWITVDVNVRPTKMELSGVKNHVVQGTNVLLICDVHGARPAATVRWQNGSIPITNESLLQTIPEDNRDGTFTTKSSLTFQASHWENGRTIHCYAENAVTKRHGEPELHEVLVLDVRYPPVISVAPPNITLNESTRSAMLLCNYFANPQELKGIVWTKDGKNMTLSDTKKYEGGTIKQPPLIIKNVTREDMGEYTCSLKNEVGSETSDDSILLNVQYAPDVEVIMGPSTPVRAVDKGNVMLECNITSGNPASLLKVRWFLDGELMKEFPECNYTSFDENGNGEGSGGPFCGLDPSILSLERVDETFAGNYTCQGKNVAGWGPVSEAQELVVYYPPSPAKVRYYPSTVVKGASVTLECKVDHPGRPANITYNWYRGSHQMTEYTTSSFNISPVRLETKSNFTCIAQNEGGQSLPATVFINVHAPPAFIQKLKSYQGVLYSSQHINLTCRVECSPMCSIVWMKDGHLLDTSNNKLYYVKTHIYSPDLRKNDFESIESTLIWNMTSWPGGMLNKTLPNSNYTCKSQGNVFGAGVNSTIEIAVDYPPEDLQVTSRIVNVIENQSPDPVKCHGRGHPKLSYQWKRNSSAEAISTDEELRLGPLTRADTGGYICEARNKHGNQSVIVYFNVQYTPECSITVTEKDGSPALVCTAHANPQEVTFLWKVRESNDTSIESANIIQEGLKSYLILDSSVDTFRTYLCYANNSVGVSVPCERDVAGNLPWWKRLNQDKLIIIIAAIIAIIICVVIICIVIIILCRRKRADTKSPMNPSSTGDKTRLGAAPPVGGSADPSNDPNVDKGFYENLPFHGMQNPPNKPVSVIAPFKQVGSQKISSSVFAVPSGFSGPFQSNSNAKATIKRNQSFHGFQSTQIQFGQTPWIIPKHSSNPFLNSQSSGFSSKYFNQNMGAFRATAPISASSSTIYSHKARNPFSFNQNPIRIIGRREAPITQTDIRTTLSGINIATDQKPIPCSEKERKLEVDVNEKRFGSLELKKHKCYSPTFYSMRCKKHAKKRPVIYALPKKCLSDARLDKPKELDRKKSVTTENLNCDFLNLTDSIQIFEEPSKDKEVPKPAPRCKKHKHEIIYQNVAKQVLGKTEDSLKNSTESIDEASGEVSVTEVQVHAENESLASNSNNNKEAEKDKFCFGSKENPPVFVFGANTKATNTDNKPSINSFMMKVSPHAMKNSPMLKVSPNFIKPKTESPKGALSLQIQAKRKNSPMQSPNSDPNKSQSGVSKSASQPNTKDDDNCEPFPEVPQMPLLNVQNKWIPNNVNQNAFYTLTTPHYKNPVIPPQYSTIPNQKHTKLIPKSLFQEQLPKSKSFSSKTKQKKHFQIPLQKCHSFKFQTAESYFQPIKNIHEENLMRNGYMSDYPEGSRVKHKQKTKGPLVLRRPSDYQENMQFQENIQNSVQLQYPQPMLVRNPPTNKPNGVVYADLDMPKNSKKSSHDSSSSKKSQKHKPKTEYATLKFNDIGQEIDV